MPKLKELKNLTTLKLKTGDEAEKDTKTFNMEELKDHEIVDQIEIPEPDEETTEGELTPKQQFFCELYASNREFFGNGVQSYLEAYDPPRDSIHWYDSACSSASRLLGNVKVFTEINRLLEVGGLNDVAVDKQLSFVISQHADFRSKVAAIREYNALRKRIQQKIDLTSGGKPIAGNTIVFTEFKVVPTKLDKPDVSQVTSLEVPTVIEGPFPGEAVDLHLKVYGHLPVDGCCEHNNPDGTTSQ